MKSKKSKELDNRRRKAFASKVFATETKKRLFLVAILALLLIAVSIVCVIQRNKPEKQKGAQVGQYFVKQMQCYQDADCPDGTFCDGLGLCVTTDLLPLPSARNVLGRGRASEGKTIKASARSQGQGNNW